MKIGLRSLVSWSIAAAIIFALGAPSLALGRKGPRISIGDHPSWTKGSPGFVLVEVSDFQCPYCGESAREVMPDIFENFVTTGKVELLFLNLPLRMHPHALEAAEAAACAGDQKMFWDMHSVLFNNQQALAPDQLSGHAQELGLDMAAFQKCLSSGRHGADIRQDIRIAQTLGITGTPAYLLGRRIPGGNDIEVLEIVKGVKPYPEMEAKLNALLASK